MNVELDRFEGEYAVILWNEKEVNIPRAWISSEVGEGTQLTVKFQKVDPSSVSHDVDDILERLGNDSKDLEGFEL